MEPWWNPRGTLAQGRPGPPRSLSGLRPQSCQLLGKNRSSPCFFFLVPVNWFNIYGHPTGRGTNRESPRLFVLSGDFVPASDPGRCAGHKSHKAGGRPFAAPGGTADGSTGEAGAEFQSPYSMVTDSGLERSFHCPFLGDFRLQVLAPCPVQISDMTGCSSWIGESVRWWLFFLPGAAQRHISPWCLFL